MQEAKDSFSSFVNAFHTPAEGMEAFAIKQAYAPPDHSLEHIWVGNLTYDGKQFHGVVNNSPSSTKLVNLGDSVKIDPEKISDWMYLDKGVLRGGYTIRVMRNQLSEKEKEEFDQSVGFIIEEL